MTVHRRVFAAVAAAAVVATTGCGSGSTNAAAADPTSTPGGLVINFGDQQQNFETLMHASGALAGARYRVNFVEFDNGPLVNAGFAAHRIDVGFMGDLPASLAAKAGLPVRTIAVERPIGATLYVLARPGISSLEQLRGKRVAYTTGTAQQAFALRALHTVGLSQADVRQVNVGLQQLGTVLESGSADASIVSVEQKVDYEQGHHGAQVLATTDSVSPPLYVYLLATTDALADSAKLAAIDDLTRRLITAAIWEKAHESAWIAAYYVGLKHQTEQVAQRVLAAGGTVDFVPISADVPAALQNVVDLLVGAGAVPASYSVAPLFDAAESERYNALLAAAQNHG